MDKPKVLFLLPYPLGKAPSQRFRVEAFLPLLSETGVPYTLRPFMTAEIWQVLYKGGSVLQKAGGILKGYLKRFKTVLFEAPRYDSIFIHREAAPLGPPVFEWYLAKVLRKKIIYDFDDAIWIPNTSAQNRLAAGLKAFWKTGAICRWSHTTVVGNDYLGAYAQKKGSRHIVKIPTLVDTEHRYIPMQPARASDPVTIGWTGSHSTLPYLDSIMPVLARLQKESPFRFLVIADKKPQLPLKDWAFIPWNPQTEIEDLSKIDIGVMPLTADPWSEGKCGFKLIQYLALGIPAVASPVGVNKIIVEAGSNGFLADSTDDWMAALRQLLKDAGLRQQMGRAGRAKIEKAYSLAAYKQTFLALFE